MSKKDLLDKIMGGMIVSCQALEHEPLNGSIIMARMALAAQQGGAVGIRANTVEDITEIRKMVELPIIGIIKAEYKDSAVYITPSLEEILKLICSPADIIAMDATPRNRPGNAALEDLINEVKKSGKLAMADISTFDEGINAEKMGFDLVSTTLSGYTPYSRQLTCPDFELIKELSTVLKVPVIAEGRIKTSDELVECFKNGAFSAVVGGAITRPQLITKDFVNALFDHIDTYGRDIK